MNIPRPFNGMNYISRLISNFQDGEITECPKLLLNEIQDVTEVPLQVKKTAEVGISATTLSELFYKMGTAKGYELDGFAVAKDGALICSGYRPPYSKEEPHITNSTCKTITAIAVMFAISEGLVGLEDTVLSFFPEYETMLTPKFVKQITVEHLLTMTSGSKCTEVTSVVEQDWVKAFLLTDCHCEPGTQFIYNSMNTYMLAAIVTKMTEMSLMEYLRPRLFEPLGINNIKWELCPMGIERGGWGMHLSLEGMLKIGIFLAENGKYNGKQLLDEMYIRQMKEKKVEQNVDSLSTGYGYQLWHLPQGIYMLSGMFGQHVLIDEKRKLVVATNAHNDKMFPDSQFTRTILQYMMDDKLYRPDGKLKETICYNEFMKEIQAFCNGWELPKNTRKRSYWLYSKKQEMKISEEIENLKAIMVCLNGKRLYIEQASFKLFPYMLQGMYLFPPFPVTELAFQLSTKRVKVCFVKDKSNKDKKRLREADKLVIQAGFAKYYKQIIKIGENEVCLAAKVFFSKDEDGNGVLQLDMVFPAAGFSRRIKFFFMEERISIECMEYPDMRTIMERFLYGETSLGGNSIDLTGKLPEGVRVLMEHKIEPRVYGVLKE